MCAEGNHFNKKVANNHCFLLLCWPNIYLAIQHYTHNDQLLSLSLYLSMHIFMYIDPSTYPSTYIYIDVSTNINHTLTCMSISRPSTCETLFSKNQLSLLNIYTNYINLSLSVCTYTYVQSIFTYISIYPSTNLYIHRSVTLYLSIHIFVYIYPSTYPFTYIHIDYQHTCEPVCPCLRRPRVRRYSARRS